VISAFQAKKYLNSVLILENTQKKGFVKIFTMVLGKVSSQYMTLTFISIRVYMYASMK
jgi:hypothetical protein